MSVESIDITAFLIGLLEVTHCVGMCGGIVTALTIGLSNQKLNARLQDGYDHSYNFISTFMNEHIQHHSQALSI